jgi:putative acetyltransferase
MKQTGNIRMRMEKTSTMDKEKLLIREENQTDTAGIGEVTVAAFKTLAISSHTEHFIVDALRAAGALTVSLVAEVDGRLVGHLALSPVTIAGATAQWYGLGPISVSPEMQRQGIGKALIEEGLSRLRQLGGGGCCLVGHPDYYRRFGFVNVDGLGLTGVPPEVFFALSFDGFMPRGEVVFHPGFQATGL